MRLVVDLLVGINALGVIVGYTIRRARGARRDRVAEEIRRLEDENRQWDEHNERMSR